MTDRYGTTLKPGDSVLVFLAEEYLPVRATVLRGLVNGRYLVQRDPPSRPMALLSPAARSLIERIRTLRPRVTGADVQEPFEVPGGQLMFFGEWDDEEKET